MHIQGAAYVLSDWCWQALARNLDARCKPVRAWWITPPLEKRLRSERAFSTVFRFTGARNWFEFNRGLNYCLFVSHLHALRSVARCKNLLTTAFQATVYNYVTYSILSSIWLDAFLMRNDRFAFRVSLGHQYILYFDTYCRKYFPLLEPSFKRLPVLIS